MSSLRKLIPLADRILIRRIVKQSQTAGGVYLPETKAQKINEGEVVAVGTGKTSPKGDFIPVALSVGDKVLLPEYGGHTVSMNEEELTLIREDEILGKFA
eukprot:CAMPEP_0171464282 /NCGR_PEP_ID=MMETSP0945-20130129/7646_1 /TAXON_ID=109269 /ORGANISM="Vaucheria litorea, Strain CCMP2940" /LENGTH=99 /DNA_ID=CAMNT_0011991305 /DNA_START=38 /DNA_END=337 /DNA_ORIENTATION=+